MQFSATYFNFGTLTDKFAAF